MNESAPDELELEPWIAVSWVELLIAALLLVAALVVCVALVWRARRRGRP